MMQRRAAQFAKGRYGMYESVTHLLEERTWNGLAQDIAEANTLDLFKSKLAH